MSVTGGIDESGVLAKQRWLLPVITSGAASVITGTALVATRYVVPQADGLTVAMLRYVVASACVLPLVTMCCRFEVARGDLIRITGLGVLYFGMFPWCISAAMQYTTASTGAIVLASTPAMTLIVARLRGAEILSTRKGVGVMLAIFGAAVAFGGTGTSFSGTAWLGNLLMVLATLLGAVYAVFSKPFLAKYPPLIVTAHAMGAGALSLLAAWVAKDLSAGAPRLDAAGWLAILYIGSAGGAFSFFLYAWALGRATPTATMILLPLNPIAAVLAGSIFLGEPLSKGLFAGLALVVLGVVLVVNSSGETGPPKITLDAPKP